MHKPNSFYSHHKQTENFALLDTFPHPDLNPALNPRPKFNAKPFKELDLKAPLPNKYSSQLGREDYLNLHMFTPIISSSNLFDGEDSDEPNRNYRDTDRKKFLAVSAKYLSLSP